MSYRGNRGRGGGGFSVTTERDGSRYFDDESRRGGGGSRKYGGRGRGHNSYRGSRGRAGYGGSRGGPNPRSRLMDPDGDVSMSDTAGPSTSRYNPYGSRPQSRKIYVAGSSSLAMDRGGRDDLHARLGSSQGNRNSRKRGRDNRQFDKASSGWYRVTIPYGAQVEKDELLRLINSKTDVPFQPIQYHNEQKAAVFYLNDQRAADAIRSVNRSFNLPSGFKIIVIVRPSGQPSSQINEETKEILKVSMSGRYDVTTKTLNLSSLYQDPKMVEGGIHMAINKYNVMNQVIQVIEENIPELTSLDLSCNKIYSLDNLTALVSKTPHLTHLSLAQNKLKSVEELTKIKNWKLDEIVLDGNDLCDQYKDKISYISAVRKQLPNVLKLDGHELPPPIKFDLELSTELPPSKDNYFKNDVIRDLVVKFVKQYYDVFDSENRAGLIAAYHDEAVFSLNFSYNSMISGKQTPWPDLLYDSRNLRKVKDTEKRLKMLKRGKQSIISFFGSRNFPKTTHDRNSFQVDINIATNELLIFTVTGIFKEGNPGKSDRDPLRIFRRVFSTVSQGGGVVITNDVLTISNAGPQQVQRAFKTPAPTPSSSPILGVAPLHNPLDTEAAKLAMAQQFSQQSGMNLEYSTKCLQQNGWDFEKAAKIFTEFHKEGKIPPEAFKQ